MSIHAAETGDEEIGAAWLIAVGAVWELCRWSCRQVRLRPALRKLAVISAIQSLLPLQEVFLHKRCVEVCEAALRENGAPERESHRDSPWF